ncbi:helix-turn-helix domain-containing protein [Tenacibaculum sp. 190130A14a]|uniref:helix-turn-helix domain-containing protein n=1 Tax=Tenacibaculum polynesiense TaxID=3137857 RepID=UPI0032B280B0
MISFVVLDVISGAILLVHPSLEHILLFNLTFLACLIWYIGYYSLNQTHIFLVQQELPQNKKSTHPTKKENRITEIQNLPEFSEKLEVLFRSEQLYKKQNLTLRETAALLDITDKKLSNYLNTSLKTSFYEFVNSYRINHFKKSIQNGQSKNLTLLALAFDAGFNSKATFNRTFKQKEGITPLQFKKSIEKSLTASSESI